MTPTTRNKIGHTAAIALLAVALAALAGGCQAAAGLLSNASGPSAIEPQLIPRKVPTLILAELAPGALAEQLSAEDLSRLVAAEWNQHQISPLVDAAALEKFRSQSGSKFRSMSVSDIGRGVGAEQVLYISVIEAQTEATADMIRGKGSARLKMIDVKTGQTLWPTDAAGGFPVEEVSEFVAKGNGVYETSVLAQTREVLAEDSVRLFYKYQPDH